MGISKKLILFLNSFLLKKIKPDLTFVHTVNKKNLINRLKKRKNKNRYDKFNFQFYHKAQSGFLKISKNKKNYIIIDSNNKIIYNKKKILNQINKII